MTEKVVCPHCKHEYNAEDDIALSSTYSHGKFICIFGCGQEFPASKFKSDGSHNSLHGSIKSFMLQNKIVSRTILIMAILFMLIGFTIFHKYHDVIIITITDDPEIIMDVMKHVSDEDQVNMISAMIPSLEKKIPQDQVTRKKWTYVKSILTIITTNSIKYSGRGSTHNYASSNVSIAYYLQVFLIVFIPLFIIYCIICLAIILVYKSKSRLIRFLGAILIMIGLIGLLISLNMRTTVGTTYNIGLLSNKQNSILIALAIILIGVILQALRYYSERKNRINDQS